MKKQPLKIILDNRERGLIQLLKEGEFYIDYEVKQLDIADIVISKNVAIERKEGKDFVASIMDNRLFEQLLRLKEVYPSPMLVLEGLNDEVFETTGMNINSIYGALAFISYKMGVAIIPTRHLKDTLIVVERIAYREQVKDEIPVLARSAPKGMELKERRVYILEGLIDIGKSKAMQLIEEFRTPFRVFQAIKHTRIVYTRTGNPKGIEGPLSKIKGFGFKFIEKNQEVLFGTSLKGSRELELEQFI